MTDTASPAWAERILGDLRAFADLGAPVESTYADGVLTVSWTMSGIAREAEFRGGGGPGRETVRINVADLTYESFLASAQVADLAHLAEQTRLWDQGQRSLSRQPIAFGNGAVQLDDVWVSPLIEADPTSGKLGEPDDALTVLADWIEREGSDGSTRLLFLTAQAGEGKSTLLRRLTAHCAQRHLTGKQHRLPLYIDAQGSGLSQLGQAIAKALDDLRSHLTYRSVESLVREGLVVLIIDGFDELIGARGTFDDAFSSLSTFVARLAGRGSIIAATRSVYYEQEYRDRAASLGLHDNTAYELEPFRLVPWDDDRRRAYQDALLDQAGISGEAREAVQATLEDVAQGEAADLLRKPLFARDMSVLVLQEALAPQQQGETVIARLVRSYNVRESGKLVGAQGEPVLTHDQLGRLYTRVAEEMWDLEAREVDPQTLAFVAEDVADEAGLGDGAKSILTSRMAYLSMFRQAQPGRPYVGFEHELFFWYFLARAMAQNLGTAQGWERRMLAKAAISSEAAGFAAADLIEAGGGVQGALDLLSVIARTPGTRALQVTENAGHLAAGVLLSASHDATVTGVRVSGLTFAGIDLCGLRLSGCVLDGITMHRCNLQGAVIEDSTATDVFLRQVLIDPQTTRLGLSGLRPGHNVAGLQTVRDGAVRTEYDPADILKALQQVGAADVPPPEPLVDVAEGVVELVERLCRAYARRNKIGDGYANCADIFFDPAWPQVRQALIDADLVALEHHASSGPAQQYYRRRFLPDDLMAGLWREADNPAIDRFWRALSA